MKITSNRNSRQRGTQVAELAVVLPVMVLMALIIAEGSAFIRLHEVINNAAREGARLSSLPENHGHTADIVQAVSTYACNNGVQLSGTGLSTCSGAAPTVCQNSTINILQDIYVPSGAGGLQASKVTVQCQYQLTYLPALPWFGISNQVALTGSAEFQEF